MNKVVLTWIVVLLASLTAAAAAAVWLIVAGVQHDVNSSAGFSPAPWIVFAVCASAAVTASLTLLRTSMTADGSLARESFIGMGA